MEDLTDAAEMLRSGPPWWFHVLLVLLILLLIAAGPILGIILAGAVKS
jgi:hypothetical protein